MSTSPATRHMACAVAHIFPLVTARPSFPPICSPQASTALLGPQKVDGQEPIQRSKAPTSLTFEVTSYIRYTQRSVCSPLSSTMREANQAHDMRGQTCDGCRLERGPTCDSSLCSDIQFQSTLGLVKPRARSARNRGAFSSHDAHNH